MWVNKEFILRLNTLLKSINEGNVSVYSIDFNLFKAGKYQETIAQLQKLFQNYCFIRNEIITAVEEKYSESSVEKNRSNPEISNLIKINQNLKNLTEDLHTVAAAFRINRCEAILPARKDHPALRNSLNESFRTVSTRIATLKEECKCSQAEIERLKQSTVLREHYKGQIIEVLEDLASGNDRLEIPWCDEDHSLFEAMQAVHSLFRKLLRFLQGMADNTAQDLQNVPCAEESSLGECLMAAAESFSTLRLNLGQCRQRIDNLEQEQNESHQVIRQITDILQAVAQGDYTGKQSFNKKEPALTNALEQLKNSFEEIATAARKVAEGDLNAGGIVPQRHRQVKTSFHQMLRSIKRQEEQAGSQIREKSRELMELQKQLTEVVAYNIDFGKRYEELSTLHMQTIVDLQGHQRVVDRLQKKTERSDEALKSIRQKTMAQARQIQSLNRDKEGLLEVAARTELLVQHLITDLKERLIRLGSFAVENPLDLQQLVEQIEAIQTSVSRVSSELETSGAPLQLSEIEIRPYMQDLKQELHPLEVETGKSILLKIDDAVPETLYSDDERLKTILEILVGHGLRHTAASHIFLDIQRLARAENATGFQPAIEFEIRAENKTPPTVRQQALGGCGELDGTGSPRWQDRNPALGLLRELAGRINAELHLHSIQGGSDIYQLQIPLNREGFSEDDSSIISSEKGEEGKLIFVLQDDRQFLQKVTEGFGRELYRCLPLDNLEEVFNLAELSLPQAICLGVKWFEEDALTRLESVSAQVCGGRIPLIVLAETEEAPVGCQQLCIGHLRKSADSSAYQRLADRLRAYHNYSPIRLAVSGDERLYDHRIRSFLKAYNLSSRMISGEGEEIPECSHLLVLAEDEKPDLEALKHLIRNFQCRFPGVSVILAAAEAGYRLHSCMEPVVDALVSLENIDDDLLYELIRLLKLLESLPNPEKRQRISAYLTERGNLIQSTHALMMTENASDTLALRKQLNQLGMTIRISTPLQKVLSKIKKLARCDLLILHAMNSERKTAELIREIRASTEHHTLPVLVISKHVQLGDEEFWHDQGATFFLKESAPLIWLLSVVRVLVASRV